jgi:hypothetical protein
MTLAALALLHTDDMDVVYFWSAVLIAVVPVAVFATIAVLVVRGYYRRRIADGGGEPPPPVANRGWRVVPRGGPSDIHR